MISVLKGAFGFLGLSAALAACGRADPTFGAIAGMAVTLGAVYAIVHPPGPVALIRRLWIGGLCIVAGVAAIRDNAGQVAEAQAQASRTVAFEQSLSDADRAVETRPLAMTPPPRRQ